MQRAVLLFVLCAPSASLASGAHDQPWWQRVLTIQKCSTAEGRESLQTVFGSEEPETLIELEEIHGLSLYWGPVYVPTEGDKRTLEETALLFFLTGRTLVVAGGYRTLKTQIDMACDEVLHAHRRGEEPRIPSMIALPGASMHGRKDRVAVDVQLGDEDGVPLWIGTYSEQWRASKYYVQELAALMYSTGWYRYVAEIWHFERAPRRNVRRGCFTFPDGPGCECELQPKPVVAQVAATE